MNISIFLYNAPPFYRLFWKFFLTCVVDSRGAVLAHKVCCLAPVSRSHIEISLLPCKLAMIQDCCNGCVMARLRRAPATYQSCPAFSNQIFTTPNGNGTETLGAYAMKRVAANAHFPISQNLVKRLWIVAKIQICLKRQNPHVYIILSFAKCVAKLEWLSSISATSACAGTVC